MGAHLWEHTYGSTPVGTHLWEHTYGNTPMGAHLWEQSLLAMNDDTVLIDVA